MPSLLKRVLVGRPLASVDEGHQRLIKTVALAVFASDAISSTAYATEEILLVLVPVAGMASLEDLLPISFVVTILLAIVVTSYRQTIHAYPNGGGSYIVSKDNLGDTPALVAGASLLVDYVLTVAVSVSAGVAAITSAYPEFRDYRVLMCLGFIALMSFANLRGLKEAGRVFAVPTYVYIVTLSFLILYGLFRSYSGDLAPLPVDQTSLDELTQNGKLLTGISLFALLRAFSSGAVALSGVEAISNGVPAFKKPESKNAASTLVIMGGILAVAFFGISLLAHRLQPTVSEHETLLSILGRGVFGDGTIMYLLLQFSTFAILVLAANTAFSGFPLLSQLIARDGYLPRQLANRGDRLVFSNGIFLLAGAAAVLVVVFGGETTALIPLYAVGVFTGFTLSQAGMVVRHRRLREPRWQLTAAINGLGAVVTGVVLAVVVVSKFTIGAWIPVVIIPLLVILLRGIHRHYERVRRSLEAPPGYRARRHTHTVVVLVGAVNKASLAALTYARSLEPDRLVAVTVVSDGEQAEQIQAAWDSHDLPVTLTILSSPYRELTGPVIEYLDELDARYDNDIITVTLPEFVLTRWWEQVLHNQSALLLKARLLFRSNTVVVSVPYVIRGDAVDITGESASSPNEPG
ncbi:MAG: APC family permease [Acidimicrobiales bacterium]